MESLLMYGVLFYILYLPIFVYLLSYSSLKHKNYSIFTHMVSHLGSATSPAFKLFNASIIIFGFSSLFFVILLSENISMTMFSRTGVILLISNCISSVAVGITPMDKHPQAHQILSYILFGGVFFSAAFLTPSIINSTIIPRSIVVLNILVVVITGRGAIAEALRLHIKKRKGELYGIKKFIKQYISFWEWMSFMLAVLWDFFMAIVLIGSLLVVRN